MAQQIADGVRELGDTVANMGSNKKVVDLQRNFKDSHSKQNATTDAGVKVADVDHWLKTVDEKNDRVGPSLLEDQIARERVRST